MKIVISNLIRKNLIPGGSQILAEMVFNDLLRLLNFIHHSQKEGSLSGSFLFNDQISYLDEIWHVFILHTKLYNEYCLNQFGEFLHHTPDPEEEIKNLVAPGSLSLSDQYMQQLNLLISCEGEDFANRIFFQYPLLFKQGTSNE